MAYLKNLSSRWYVCALSAAIVLSGYGQYLWQYNFQDWPLIKAQPPGVSILLIGVAIAGFFWLFLQWNPTTDKLLKVVIGALFLTWFAVIAAAISHQELFTHSVWTYLPILAMLSLKVPRRQDLEFSIIFFSWLIVIILIFTRVMELTDNLSLPPLGEMTEYERQNYWLPLSGNLGPDFRWPGPMGHNAMTGVAGAFLIVVGANFRRFSGLIFIIIGVLVLLLTNSRVSMVAAAIGFGIVLFLGPNKLASKFSWRSRVSLVTVVAAIAGGAALIVSPNLTGRNNYWPAFVDLWLQSPFTGVGKTGRAEGDPLISQTNAHNIFLDILALYGVIPLIALIAALIGMVLITYRAARIGDVLPFAIVVTFIVVGLTQSDHGWTEPSEPWWLLIMGVFLGSQVTRSITRNSHAFEET